MGVSWRQPPPARCDCATALQAIRATQAAHTGDLQAITAGLAAIRATLATLGRKQDTTMTALQNLQDADTALKTEVTTAITDWAAALTAANASANDPAIQAVADDMTAQAAALAAADPATPAAPPVTGTSN